MRATGWNFAAIPVIGGAPESIVVRMEEPTEDGLATLLVACAFDFANPRSRPCPIFRFGGVEVCTEGNLMNIQSLPKAGKSAVIESMLAAAFNGNRMGADMLGFSANNWEEGALIHLDTEQSPFDYDCLVRRSLRRAGVESPPPWFKSFTVLDLSVANRRAVVAMLMEQGQRDHGGVFAVLIDGVGDLCLNPNDPAESLELVDYLHKLSVRYSTTIITVLHENPGSETGKTRGHLGSHLERKAETNLRLAKDKNNVTTMWSERARHLYWAKGQGICFTWNDQAQMHTTCGSGGEAILGGALDEARRSFGDREVLTYTCLVAGIRESLGLAARSAKGRIPAWLSAGAISKVSGGYRLSAS